MEDIYKVMQEVRRNKMEDLSKLLQQDLTFEVKKSIALVKSELDALGKLWVIPFLNEKKPDTFPKTFILETVHLNEEQLNALLSQIGLGNFRARPQLYSSSGWKYEITKKRV